MILDIRDLPDTGLSFERAIDLPDLGREQGAPLGVSRVLLTGRVVPGIQGVDLSGRVSSKVELECSRCLEPYRHEIRADFFLRIVPEPPEGDPRQRETGSGDHEMAPGDASIFRASGGKADLRTVACEQIYLNLPLKPICRVACAGLCPTCGVNRNRIECGCRSAELGPRLTPLMDLKNQLEDS